MARDFADVLSQMEQAGLPELPERLDFGKRFRFGKKKRGWYICYEHYSAAQQGYFITGAYGYWGLTEKEGLKITAGTERLTDAEFAELRAKVARQRQEAALEKRLSQLSAADRARVIWRQASSTGQSAYLDRKGLAGQAESVKYGRRGELLVPLIRYDRERDVALIGLQMIFGDGVKRYLKGNEKDGAACRLGPPPVEIAVMCEGWATGISIRWATARRFTVFVAFDAGNLLLAGHVVRKVYPGIHLVYAFDDDYLTIAQGPGTKTNPGRTLAWLAAKELGNASLIRPVWTTTKRGKATDFDDLRQLEGLDAVTRVFRPIVEMVS
jgi:putative DNA primase/helicase